MNSFTPPAIGHGQPAWPRPRPGLLGRGRRRPVSLVAGGGGRGRGAASGGPGEVAQKPWFFVDFLAQGETGRDGERGPGTAKSWFLDGFFQEIGQNSAPEAPPELSFGLYILISLFASIGGHGEARYMARCRDRTFQKKCVFLEK